MAEPAAIASLSLPPLNWRERLMTGAGGRLDRFVMEHFLRRSGFAGPVEGEDIMERAKEIFDEDSPTNKSPNPLASDSDDLDF